MWIVRALQARLNQHYHAVSADERIAIETLMSMLTVEDEEMAEKQMTELMASLTVEDGGLEMLGSGGLGASQQEGDPSISLAKATAHKDGEDEELIERPSPTHAMAVVKEEDEQVEVMRDVKTYEQDLDDI